MKKVLVVAALLGVMLIAASLKQAGESSATTLAGIGFVMLAAYALAELGKSLSLPQVTGYIVAGAVLGPSVGGIISGEVVSEMRMFNTLALGLIATSAGLELDVRQVARLGKTLLLTTLIKVVVGGSLVALTLLVIESSFGYLGLQSRSEILTLALVAGVLSIGTSPSIALAVLSETRAKGRLADLVLGAAVFKDLVVVVGLAIAVAVGRVMLQPGATLDAGVLGGVAFELLGSIGAGAVVGLIFILYVRFIGAEMLLFLAAMILVVAELCRSFHLELLLVFIAAGFVVRNLSKFEHDLMRPLALVALPVFVVFFANAGASIDLVTTWKILPLALALCVVRAGSFFLAGRLGGKWAGEPSVIVRQAWLAYLPQAGVTLGLVGLAALQLPELATPITNTGMAVVALNLLIGPITLRRALGLAGEIPKPAPNGGAAEGASNASVVARQYSSPLPHESASTSFAALPEPLKRAHASLADGAREALARFAAEVEPHLPALPALSDQVPRVEIFRELVISHRAAYQSLYTQLSSVLGRVPKSVKLAPFEDTRHRRTITGFWRRRRGHRLPLRRLARIALGPALARHVVRSFEGRLRGRSPSMNGREPDSEESVGGGPRLPVDIELGLARLVELMRDAGVRRLPAGELRYSDVEPQVRKQLQSLLEGTEGELARLVQAAWGSRLLELRRTEVTEGIREVVARCVVEPALGTAANLKPATQVLVDWLERRRADFDSEAGSAASVARLGAELGALTRSALGELSREFRFAGTIRTTQNELKARVANIPLSIDCLWLAEDGSLLEGKIAAVQLRVHIDALIRHVMPPLELAARSVSAALNQVPRRVEDALRPEWTLLEAQVESAEARDIRALVDERLPRARRRVERVARATVEAVQAALAALDAALASACSVFATEVRSGLAARGDGAGRIEKALARLRQALMKASSWLRFEGFGEAPLLDAAAIRRTVQGSPRSDLPELVQRWFDSAPVSDERIFVAHRRLLDRVLDAEVSRAETGRASLLIIGPKGAGKSSLLNMCELELPSAAHLRLHASEFGRETTLFEALGSLLECPPTLAGLTRHLALRRPAIFVDDLATWVYASPHRQLELERLLHLFTTTAAEAFWFVSIDVTMLRLLTEMADVEEAFTHLIHLPPLDVSEVRRLVESRLELSGQRLTWQVSGWSRLIAKLERFREHERAYRAIWSAAAGNPARVVSLCREVLRGRGKDLVAQLDAVSSKALPAHAFSEAQLAVLATLHRYGPQTLERMQGELAVSLERLERSAGFLIACGLVTLADEGHAYSVSPAAEWVVLDMLVGAGLAVAA